MLNELTDFDIQNAYLSHIQPLADGRDSDLAITACFLSIPLVSLLYAVLSFSLAIVAFCIQNNDVHGKILLTVVLGVLGVTGLITLLFFWHVWRGPREQEISEEKVEEVEVAVATQTVEVEREMEMKKEVEAETEVEAEGVRTVRGTPMRARSPAPQRVGSAVKEEMKEATERQ